MRVETIGGTIGDMDTSKSSPKERAAPAPQGTEAGKPAQGRPEETTDERTAVQAALDEWVFRAKERLLMRALAGHIAELNLLMSEWKKRR